MTETANLLSFPELFLILRRHDRAELQRHRISAISLVHAACAPWNKQAATRANEHIKSLAPPKPVDTRRNSEELIQMFASAGIPIKRG